MARLLVQQRIPVDLSVVEFDLDQGEELFLTYTWEREHGPGITRDGIGPPKMPVGTNQETTNAYGMRLACWLTRDELLDEEIEATTKELKKLERQGADKEAAVVGQVLKELTDTKKGAQTTKHSNAVKAHDRVFIEKYPGYEIVAQQGCGDLTMNAWNVAYVNNRLAKTPPALVHVRDEKFEYRTYSCLVKWAASEAGVRRMTIEDVRFFGPDSPTVEVRYDREWVERSGEIELAISNQQVIRDGGIVSAVTICRQFGDLRHLLQLPNLNPDKPLHPRERPQRGGSFRPRTFKNKPRTNDIWLGEESLIAPRAENLLRMALSGPIVLDLPSDEDNLRGALELAGYTEVFSDLQPLKEGQWRLVTRGDNEPFLEVFFKRNTYSWSMVGLNADNRKLLWLACTGVPGESGYRLEQAAEVLLEAGAWNALLIDEGWDVMQAVKWEAKFVDMVPLKRRRLRSTFIVGKPKKES